MKNRSYGLGTDGQKISKSSVLFRSLIYKISYILSCSCDWHGTVCGVREYLVERAGSASKNDYKNEGELP